MKLVLDVKCAGCGTPLPPEASLENGGHLVCSKCSKVVVKYVSDPLPRPVVVSKPPRGW